MNRFRSTLFQLSPRCLLGLLMIVPCLVPCLAVRADDSDDSPGRLVKVSRKAMRRGDFEEAEKGFRQALTLAENNLSARLGLAQVLLKERRLKDAFDEAGKICASSPSVAQAHSIRGAALMRSGLFHEAFTELKTALDLNGEDDLALATAAEMSFYENQVVDAERLIATAAFLNPDEADYHLLRARIASRQQRYRSAASALQDFLRAAPKTDLERRERIEGVIRFYSYLGNTKINLVQGPRQATVPISLQSRRPHLKVKINGKGPFNFVVDTGASISVLSLRAANQLGLRPIAEGGQARAVGGGGTFPIIYGLINSLEIGDVKVSCVPVYLREIQGANNTSPNEGTDGFLGLSVLNEFLVTLDYQNRQMKFEPTAPKLPSVQVTATTLNVPGAAPTRRIPFRVTESGLISVQTQLDSGAPLNFIFDSGASTSVISDVTVERLNWKNKILPDARVQIIGAAGTTQNVEMILAKQVQVYDLVKPDVRMPILDLFRLNESSGFEQHGILGGDFLHHCRVTIDMRNQCLMLTPSETGAIRAVARKTEGEAAFVTP